MNVDTQFNALTVDVEDYFHVAALSASISRADWNGMKPRVEQNTRHLLDIFGEAGVHATFFVLGWVAERFPALVKEIHARGHEVASHGFSHKLVYEQTQREFREETFRGKELLESLIAAPVLGYRAASYSITARSLWALDIIAEAGFQYDSSVFPVRHDLYGIPDSCPVPHKLTTEGGRELIEFPPTTFKFLGYTMPVGGGGYFRIYPYWLTRHVLNRINNEELRPFIFYLHPWEIDPGQPRIKVKALSRFRHYSNLHRTETRLRTLLNDFRFEPVSTVLSRMNLLQPYWIEPPVLVDTETESSRPRQFCVQGTSIFDA